MSNFHIPRWRVFNADGDPGSGYKLYTYEAGTTTPLATYSDQALTSANANPLVADGDGYIGNFYMTDAEYKFVLKDASDSIVWTEDNVYGNQLTSTGLATRIKQIASNPLDYGAIGDGVADESSEVQSAIDNATGTVDLLGKTYRCDSALALAAGLRLINGTLDFTNSTDDEYIKAIGTRAAATLLTANAVAGAEVAAVTSASGLAAGDWVFVTSNALYNGGSDKHGEVCRIESIAGLNVSFNEPLDDTYNTADSASLQKLNVLSNIAIEDVEILCNSAATGAGRAVYLELVEACTVRACTIDSPKASGVEIRAGINCTVGATTIAHGSGIGVGVEIAAHSRSIVVEQVRSYGAAVGFRVGSVDANDGVCRLVRLSESGAYGCTIGAHLLANSALCTLSGECTKPSGGTLYTDAGVANRIIGWDDILAANYNGLTVAGGGSGAGLHATGGATGYGVHGIGGSTSGAGVYGVGSGTSINGVEGQGSNTTGIGVQGTGGSNGDGVKGISGAAAGYGVRGEGESGGGVFDAAGSSGAPGVEATGDGTGNGVTATGGSGGHGIQAVAGGGNKNGGLFTGAGSEAGVRATGGATGYGVHGIGGTNKHGVYGEANGSGAGVYGIAESGDTGAGVHGYSEVASGIGVKAESTSSTGVAVNGTGGLRGGSFTATETSGATYGLYSSADDSSGGTGVYGTGGAIGVHGFSGSGYGVQCNSDYSYSPFRIVPHAGDPGTVADGDMWYNSTTNKFRGRAGGVSVDLH